MAKFKQNSAAAADARHTMALSCPPGDVTQADEAPVALTQGRTIRSVTDIRRALLASVEARKVKIPATLEPILLESFSTRSDFRDRVTQWSHEHSSDTGVGFFGVKLETWRVSTKSKGHQGYLRCMAPGCTWHVKIEETQDDSSRPAIAAYDVQLTHTAGAPHLPVEASKVEVATAPGSKVMPPEYKELAYQMHRSGCSPSDILRLLNTKAAEEGIPQSWDYQSVYALVKKAGVARENDATGLVQWLQRSVG